MEQAEHKEILALYGWSVSELGEFRGRQWQTVNGVLLIYAGLVATSRLMTLDGPLRCWAISMLGVFALIVMGFGVYILSRLSSALALRNERMTHIREKLLSETFRQAWKRKGESDETIHMFEFVLIVGGLISAGLIGLGLE